ncbi:MAG: hypothetical protein H0T89_00990 [Deltaproteobacteria bacterium]|nr:hypothetical protein [Deltaproteobacteria bacterium]
MIGGIATNRDRRPARKRIAQRRLFACTYADGVLACKPGGWITTITADDITVPTWDASIRLSRNIGDRVIASWGSPDDNAALEVVAIEATGWSERWRVATICGGPVANGNVLVLPAWKAGR